MKNKTFFIGAIGLIAFSCGYLNTINTACKEFKIDDGYNQDLVTTHHLNKNDVTYYTSGYSGSSNWSGNTIGNLYFELPKNYTEVEVISITGIEVRDDIHQTTRWVEEDFYDDEIKVNVDEGKTTLKVENVRSYAKGWSWFSVPGFPVYYGEDPRLTDEFDIEIKAKDGIPDKYYVGNDEFEGDYVTKTENNFYKSSKSNSKNVPFFTNEDTYEYLEKVIKENNIIASRDGIPIEYVDIIFYDESSNQINKNTKLDSSNIRMKFVSNDSNIVGESEIIDYQIPFLNIDANLKEEENIFNFNEVDENENTDPTDNITNSKWVYENNYWTFKTNIPITLNIDGENIYSFSVDGKDWVFSINEEKSLTHNQVNNKGANNFDKTIKIINRDNYEWTFKYEFHADNNNKNTIQVESLNSWNILNENQLMEMDVNNNEEIDSNEIFTVNTVNNDFLVETEENNNMELYQLENGKWNNKMNYYENPYLITNPGIYGFSTQDEYGNTNFEIVEYLDSDLTNSSSFTKFDETNLYSKNRLIAESIGVDKSDYDSFSPHEQRYLNNYIISNNLVTPNKRKFKGLMIISYTLTTIITLSFILFILFLIYKNKKQKKIINTKHEENLKDEDLLEYLAFNNED